MEKNSKRSEKNVVPNYNSFGRDIVELLNSRGWLSIPKRDLILHILDSAFRDQILDSEEDRYMLARKLRVSPQTVDNLLRDRFLLCDDQKGVWDENGFFEWLRKNNQTNSQDADAGVAVFAATRPEDRFQVEAILAKLGITPDYKNNRNLLIINIGMMIERVAAKQKTDARQVVKDVLEKTSAQAAELDNLPVNNKDLVKKLIEAAKEQSGKRIGEDTVEAAIMLWKVAKQKIQH